jgi:hypothetical protein
MRDLKDPRWMYLKAALFLVIGIVSAGLILADHWQLKTALLLALTIWSFCRAYYFAFYVVERYIDPTFKFAGIFSALTYLVQTPRITAPAPDHAAK